jgi:uncharacterized repeat protein (TIGR03803 family)
MKKKLFLVSLVLLGFCPYEVNIIKAQYVKLFDFECISTGCGPQGDLISDGTYLYGMTKWGGSSNRGVTFKIKPDGTEYSKLFEFDATTIGGSYGSLISDGTFFYGMTEVSIFKIKPDGTDYSTLLNFTGLNGAGPLGSLIYDGTFLYGMTSGGGTNSCSSSGSSCGVIFKIKPDGTDYSKLLDFGSGNGSDPRGSLFSDGTFLYGMTRAGGTNNSCNDPYGCGVIFKIKPDGTEYSKLFDFDGTTNGGYPCGSLISDGTFLYGMTTGTIFKIKPDGTEYSKLLNIISDDGSLVADGTFLYGMSNGSIFKIKSDGTGYVSLINFNGANGSSPFGSLISDGTFLYGMTQAGGINNMGVIFKLNVGTTTIVNKLPDTEKEVEMNLFPNPANKIVTITIKTTTPKEEFTLKVSDSLGKTVYSEIIKEISGLLTKQIDLNMLPKGNYFIELKSISPDSPQKKAEVKKMVLQ